MLTVQNEDAFLRGERSALLSYLQNYTLTKEEQDDCKKLARALADLVILHTKISALEHEKSSLMGLRELYALLGLDEKKLRETWSKKHTEQLKQWKTYQQKKSAYEKLS